MASGCVTGQEVEAEGIPAPSSGSGEKAHVFSTIDENNILHKSRLFL